MLHCHDKRDRHAVDEVAKFTAVGRCLSVLVLLLLPISPALATDLVETCPPRFSPPSYSDKLLIDQAHWQAMQQLRDRSRECPQLAADYAQAYFWGGAEWSADFVETQRYAALANVAPSQKWQLRLINAGFVLLGRQHGDVDAAIAVFQRELATENMLRRQRAWAVLNQLAVRGDVRQSGDHYALQLPDGSLLASDKKGNIQRLVSKAYGWGYGKVQQPPPAVFYPRSQEASFALRAWQAPAGRLIIGQLYSYYDGRQSGQCTATALSDRWLITAAHCLYPPEADAPLADVLRFFPKNGNDAAQAFRVEQLWMLQNNHRQLLNGDIAAYAGSDLALLRLDAALPGEVVGPTLGSSRDSSLLYSYAFAENTPDSSLWLSVCLPETKETVSISNSDKVRMGLLSLDCDSQPGQSGALLWQPGDPLNGVAILSANLTQAHEKRAIAASFSAPLLADIQRILRNEKPRAVHWRHVQR